MKIVFREPPADEEPLRRLQAAFPALRFAVPQGEAALAAEIADADAVVAAHWPVELIARSPRLKWIQTTYAGVDHLPVDEIRRRGIALTTYRGASAPNLSEHVLAMMLAFARGFPELMRRQSRAQWLPTAQRPVS